MSARLQNVAPASHGLLPNPALAGLVPRVVDGVLELPVYHMRGGTSTGIVLWHEHLPADLALREEAIRWLMGVPPAGEVKGNKQTTGLGRGASTSNTCSPSAVVPETRPPGPTSPSSCTLPAASMRTSFVPITR